MRTFLRQAASGPLLPLHTPRLPVIPVTLRQTPAQVQAALGNACKPPPATIAFEHGTAFPPDPLRATVLPFGYLAEVEADLAREQGLSSLEGPAYVHTPNTSGKRAGSNDQEAEREPLASPQHAPMVGDNSSKDPNYLSPPVHNRNATHQESGDSFLGNAGFRPAHGHSVVPNSNRVGPEQLLAAEQVEITARPPYPDRYRWLDGADDMTSEFDVDDANPLTGGHNAEVLPTSTRNEPHFGIRITDDLEEQPFVAVPQLSQTERSVKVQESTVMDGAISPAVNISSAFPTEGGNEAAMEKAWVDVPANCLESGEPGPSNPERFLRTVTGGPRRGSCGVPCYNAELALPSNRQSSWFTRKPSTFGLGRQIKNIAGRWMPRNRKHRKNRSPTTSSGQNLVPGLEYTTAGGAASGVEDGVAGFIDMSSLGSVAPIADSANEKETPTIDDTPMVSARGKTKVSRLKKLKSLASLSNLAAAFKLGEPTTESRHFSDAGISGPLSIARNEEMDAQAEAVRQQMAEAMGIFVEVPLASRIYTEIMPGRVLGQGAVPVDYDNNDGAKDARKTEGALENPLLTATPKKPFKHHAISSTTAKTAAAGSVDPHEGRGYEGIWAGPGIAINTPEGGIRVIQRPTGQIEEISHNTDDDAPAPRLQPMRQTLGNRVSNSSLSDPFGWEHEYQRAHDPGRPVHPRGKNTQMQLRESAPVRRLLREVNSRLFGRSKVESASTDPTTGPTTPPTSSSVDVPQVPKGDGLAATNSTTRSIIEELPNFRLTTGIREPVTPQIGMRSSAPVVPMSISSNRESQRFPDSVETTPVPEIRTQIPPTPRDQQPIDNTNNGEDGGMNEGTAVSPQAVDTASSESDTEPDWPEPGPSTQYHRRDSSSDSDDTPGAPHGNRYMSSSGSKSSASHAAPAPTTPPPRRLTVDRKTEAAHKEQKAEEGVAKQGAIKKKKARAKQQGSANRSGRENLRPPVNSSDRPMATPKATNRLQQGALSQPQADQFVLGLNDDPFYDADLEDAMQTASRQLATESLYSTESTMFANTRNRLLTAFNNPPSVTTPGSQPLQESSRLFSGEQTAVNRSQPMSRLNQEHDPLRDTQQALLEQQGLANTQRYHSPQILLDQERVARRVRENRFLTENHRRALAGQQPLASIEAQERLAPRSGPSPPPAIRARNELTGALFLRPLTPTLNSNRKQMIAVGPPASPTPIRRGRGRLMDSYEE
ncbi:hypothetical protein BGX38DRAFT_1182198 [Terfezia claveryi]|nr:hypothetical protein BGX38DRAFT_1182198 [Terfezia claveryi]